LLGELAGQGWLQIGELALAFVLSSLIGLEREISQKSAGLRTYTLVGFASALIILISKYGFTDVLVSGQVVLDPSRIAAQIVSGIGFIGGGVIFVRRDAVRGLTTAATVWLTAAVGMACGAGLPILAIVVTAGNFIVIFGFRLIEQRLPKSRWTPSLLQVSFFDSRNTLSEILATCTRQDFAVSRVRVERTSGLSPDQEKQVAKIDVAPILDDGPRDLGSAERVVTVILAVQGVRSIAKLAEKLAEIKGVVAVNAGEVNVTSE
jgi:putative Mg2+ transporter-C (MgtC) family protein